MKKLNKKVALTGNTIEKFVVPCQCYCNCNVTCDCYDGDVAGHSAIDKSYANSVNSSNLNESNYTGLN